MIDKIPEININNKIFTLRPAEDKDYNFILNLLKENMLESFIRHWGEWKDKSFEENHNKEHVRIIEYNNVNIGYLEFKFKKEYSYLNNIQLSEKFKGLGLGTYLMKLIEQETLEHGLTKIRLKVFKDNRAVNLYKREGYYAIFEDSTSLIMEKKI